MRNYFNQLDNKLAKELFGLGDSKKKKGFWRWGIIIGLAILIVAAGFFAFFQPPEKNIAAESHLSQNSNSFKSNHAKKSLFSSLPLIGKIFLPGLPDNFTLLFLGVPGGNNDAPYLTDSIIFFHYKKERNGPKKEPNLTLFSFPRDLLVTLPGQNYSAKLNALYALDKQKQSKPLLIIEKIEEISGLPIDFYVVADLEVVKNLIDLLGGINVLVKEDIHDPKFPGPNNSYQTFDLAAGWRYLDGETALKYIRSRFSPGGDFDRIDRQQQLILGIKKKVRSLNLFTSLADLIKVYQNLKDHVETNLNIRQILSYDKILEEFGGENTKRFTIDKESKLLVDDETILGGEKASVLLPKAGQENYQEIQRFITDQLK